MAKKTVTLAQVGGGMFGHEVVFRCLRDFERYGLVPYLASAGLDHHAADLADVEYEVVAIGDPKTADELVREFKDVIPSSKIRPFYSFTPWEEIISECKPDVLFVATPDHLHTPAILAALKAGVHVVSEKPLTLKLDEADEIVKLARQANLVVACDMHKRYDSFLRSAFVDVVPRLGKLNYARAVLEEPLEISTEVFKWAAQSNPFSYVGCHWTDLFTYYLGVEPVSLHAVGQKHLLVSWKNEANPEGIDTFDSMQVAVEYDNGMRVDYVNAWINPKDFEGPVNQEMEIIGTKGRVFVDQQDRGMRSAITGAGSRSHNPHFQAEVARAGVEGDKVCVGYCKDSLVAGLEAATRVIAGKATRAELVGTYPDAETVRSWVGIVDAAAQVAARNEEHRAAGRGTPVTALFADGGFRIVDPYEK